MSIFYEIEFAKYILPYQTRPQELLLLGIDCHYGQGFLFAKPMPADEFSEFLEHHTTEGHILP